MYAVTIVHSFDTDAPMVLFNDSEYDKAKAYLHWLWEDYYNTEIAEDSKLFEFGCYHEDEYAKVTWEDGECTEFVLTYSSDPDERFANVNWKRYL